MKTEVNSIRKARSEQEIKVNQLTNSISQIEDSEVEEQVVVGRRKRGRRRESPTKVETKSKVEKKVEKQMEKEVERLNRGKSENQQSDIFEVKKVEVSS